MSQPLPTRAPVDGLGMAPNEAEILFARQPIYDRALTVAGFELLFRDGGARNAAPASLDGKLATSRVLVNAFSESNIDEVCERTPAFINFNAETLIDDIPFSPDKLTVEVLESVVATPAVMQALAALRKNGYRIALDDYDRPDADHPLLAYADIVKLEYPAFSQAALTRTVAALRQFNPRITVLAEKIETWRDFEICRAADCDLFQGYFIARPEPVHGQTMPVDRLRVIQLLAALNDPDASIEQIAAVIRNDAFLSLRLLRLINSALYRRMREVTSVSTAIMTLGLARIRAFASLLALSKLEGKPHALHQLAAARAFICQTLAQSLPAGPDMGFTVGLFSCLDALLDRSLEDILERVPFNPQIAAALLRYEGALGTILHAILEHEQGRFDAIRWHDLAPLGIGQTQFMAAFRRGVAFASKQASALQ